GEHGGGCLHQEPTSGRKQGMKHTVASKVHKFTVGIPERLSELGEEERVQLGVSRSEYVANLYSAHLRELALREKIARYPAAYAKMPATPEEDELTALSEEVLASSEP